jgi:hypothetical protein
MIVNNEKTRIKRGISLNKKDLNDSNKTKEKKRNSKDKILNYQDAGVYQTNLNQVFQQENYSNIVFDKKPTNFNNFSFTNQNGQNFF